MIKQCVSAALEQLMQAVDPARRDFMANGYASSDMEFLGVKVPVIRRISKQLAKELKSASPKDAIKVSEGLIATGFHEARQVAYELLEFLPAARSTLTKTKLRSLGRGMDNWASVDSFATSIAGRAWHEGTLQDEEVHRWAQSKDPWWRRCALASTVCLNLKSRGGSGDVPKTLSIADHFVGVDDPMLAKALSWALRQAVPHDKQAVGRWLKQHTDQLPAIVRREVSVKLATGKKK